QNGLSAHIGREWVLRHAVPEVVIAGCDQAVTQIDRVVPVEPLDVAEGGALNRRAKLLDLLGVHDLLTDQFRRPRGLALLLPSPLRDVAGGIRVRPSGQCPQCFPPAAAQQTGQTFARHNRGHPPMSVHAATSCRNARTPPLSIDRRRTPTLPFIGAVTVW